MPDCLINGDVFVILNATINNISVGSCRSFYWWRNPEYPSKTVNIPEVTDNHFHIKLLMTYY